MKQRLLVLFLSVCLITSHSFSNSTYVWAAEEIENDVEYEDNEEIQEIILDDSQEYDETYAVNELPPNTVSFQI